VQGEKHVDALIRTAFQPIMSDRGQVVAYEALLRFRDDLDRPDSRESMIRRWEDCGYIGTVDVAVLKQAIASLEVLHPSLLVSANASKVTIDSYRVRYLRRLDELGDKAHRLIVEVSGTRPQEDPGVLIQFARDLAARGIRLALDDFPPEATRAMQPLLGVVRPKLIKLGRKAVAATTQDRNDGNIRELVATARAIGARVIAQGIDSQDKFDRMFEVGIRYFQGFLIGRPRQFPLLDTQASFRNIQHTQPPVDLAA
jgi:EAL domain-containing protein (putative c-di-GMP-specific phosphodiesterase class I)